MSDRLDFARNDGGVISPTKAGAFGPWAAVFTRRALADAHARDLRAAHLDRSVRVFGRVIRVDGLTLYVDIVVMQERA